MQEEHDHSLVGAEVLVGKLKDDGRLLTANVAIDQIGCLHTNDRQHQWLEGGTQCYWCKADRNAINDPNKHICSGCHEKPPGVRLFKLGVSVYCTECVREYRSMIDEEQIEYFRKNPVGVTPK